MAETPYQEYRNPVTGKVTSSGNNPYKQNIKRFATIGGGRGVRQAARQRRQLEKLRKQSQSRYTAEQQTALSDLSKQMGGTGQVTQDTRGPMGKYQATEADKAAVAAKQKQIADRNKKINPETGKKYRAGYNVGLSANEIAFNESVRASSRNLKNRIDRIRDRLGDDIGDKRAKILRNRLDTFRTRRGNFRKQLFAPVGEAGAKLPPNKPKKGKKGKGSGGGGYGDGGVAP